eukprot:g7551.t1
MGGTGEAAEAWHLLAEGQDLGAGLALTEAADAPLQASFSFVHPATGQNHSLQAYNAGWPSDQEGLWLTSMLMRVVEDVVFVDVLN